MYCAAGDISDVTSWFHHKHNPYKWLILLAAGHQNDAQMFEDVFNKKETLHIITGNAIALVLFCNGDTSATAFQSEANAYVLPCRMLSQHGLMSARLFPITDLPHELERSNIISASQTICNRLCSYFGLPISQLPAIVLIDKHLGSPITIPTKGVSDLGHLIALIKDMRTAIDESHLSIDEEIASLKHLISLDLRIHNETAHKIAALRARMRGYERECENLATKIRRCIEASDSASTSCEELLNIHNAHELNEHVGTIIDNEGNTDAFLTIGRVRVPLSSKHYKLCRCLAHMAKIYQEAQYDIDAHERSRHKSVFVSTIDPCITN